MPEWVNRQSGVMFLLAMVSINLPMPEKPGKISASGKPVTSAKFGCIRKIRIGFMWRLSVMPSAPTKKRALHEEFSAPKTAAKNGNKFFFGVKKPVRLISVSIQIIHALFMLHFGKPTEISGASTAVGRTAACTVQPTVVIPGQTSVTIQDSQKAQKERSACPYHRHKADVSGPLLKQKRPDYTARTTAEKAGLKLPETGI